MRTAAARLAGRLVLAAGVLALAAGTASAQATVTNGTIAIGVNAEGHLNTAVGSVAVNSSRTGVSYKFPDGAYRDATSPGCFCEGFGVKVTDAAAVTYTGYANVSTDGVHNLTAGAFVSDADSAVATATLTSLPGLSITHDYHPSSSANLYEATVTITNGTGGTLDNVLYRRVMDWDVPPTEFSEFVTIQGAGLGNLVYSGDNGFCTAQPGPGGCGSIVGGTENVNFVDKGPADHGAVFDFNFGSLAAGASKTFSIFYGAAATEKDALAALAAVGAEGIYSFGQNSRDPEFGTPATFIFGFGGVGAPPIDAPEPASMLLIGGGLLAAVRRYRRR